MFGETCSAVVGETVQWVHGVRASELHSLFGLLLKLPSSNRNSISLFDAHVSDLASNEMGLYNDRCLSCHSILC